ncbi:MAG: tetratricopeptide repeat protein [Nitrospirota bacterium]
MRKAMLATMVLALLHAAPTMAGHKEGVEAFQAKDYPTAMQEWRPLAEEGEGWAQFNVGLLYVRGLGLSKDFRQAASWFHKAAAQGNAAAQATLGFLYDRGWGVSQDFSLAVYWYRLAAEQGERTAQFNLGVMYHQGWGIPPDFIEAHNWYNLASAAGFKAGARWRDLVAEQMTETELAQAHRLARAWTWRTQ